MCQEREWTEWPRARSKKKILTALLRDQVLVERALSLFEEIEERAIWGWRSAVVCEMLDGAFWAAHDINAACSFSTNPRTDSQPEPMPVYEYVCRKCGEKIAEALTIKEHETKKIQCPKCQSTEVDKIIEPFFAKTSRKS